MKIFPHITSIIVLTLLLATTGCKDKNPKPGTGECTTCQSVMEAKDYFLFKVGSWWVYEEETTHERDSMYVTQSYNNTSSFDFDVRIKSSLTDYEYHYFPVYNSGGGNSSCSPSGIIFTKCLYIKESKGKFQDLVGESNCFFVAYKKGDFVGAPNINYSNNKVYIHDVLDSFQLGSFTFSKTVITNELAKIQDNNQPTNYYYSKNVGIVRKELLDSNEIWNLVNYYIAP